MSGGGLKYIHTDCQLSPSCLSWRRGLRLKSPPTCQEIPIETSTLSSLKPGPTSKLATRFRWSREQNKYLDQAQGVPDGNTLVGWLVCKNLTPPSRSSLPVFRLPVPAEPAPATVASS